MNDEDFYRDLADDVDDAHAARADANNAPPALWQQIRSQYNSEKEDTTMSMNPPLSSPDFSRPHPEVGWVQRFSGVIATLAVVAVLAFGGWFAAMNYGGNTDPEPRWAVMPASPEAPAATIFSQACDIEPMSIDRAMEIVNNPTRFMTNGPMAAPRDYSNTDPKTRTLYEREPDLELLAGNRTPTETQFADASAVADQYLACILTGTEGQLWNFYSPEYLQSKILAEFPVYRDEATIRNRVEERAVRPAAEAESVWMEVSRPQKVSRLSTNEDSALAVLQMSTSSNYEFVMQIGVVGTGSDDADVFRTNGVGTNLIRRDAMSTGPYDYGVFVTVAKLRYFDTWVVIPGPTLEEMGVP